MRTRTRKLRNGMQADMGVVNTLMNRIVQLRQCAPRTFIRLVQKTRNPDRDLWPMDYYILYRFGITTSPNQEDAEIHDAYADLIACAVTGKGIKTKVRSPYEGDPDTGSRITLKNSKRANRALIDSLVVEFGTFQQAHPIEFGELVRLCRNPENRCSDHTMQVLAAHGMLSYSASVETETDEALVVKLETGIDPIVEKVLPLCVQGDHTIEMIVSIPYDLDQFEDVRMASGATQHRDQQVPNASSNGDGHTKKPADATAHTATQSATT